MAQDFIQTSPDKPFVVQRTKLEGREFLFQFTNKQREQVSYLTIRATDNTAIRAGIKIVTNRPLLRQFKYDPRLPPGELYAFSFTSDAPPDYGELGENRRVRLTYITSDEVAESGGVVGAQ